MHGKLFYNLIIKPSLVNLDNKSLFPLIHGVYLLKKKVFTLYYGKLYK